MMNRPSPHFRASAERVDERLNQILHRALAREVDKRYATADELLYDLEHYIYHSGYGPTNETLSRYIRALFGQAVPAAAPPSAKTPTLILPPSAQSPILHVPLPH